jgi:hypothetical protein
MTITQIKWTNSDRTTIKVTLDNGEVKFCEWPNNRTYIREAIEQALASGIVIQNEDPPPPPIDLSDLDNLEKAIKALGLVIADVSGRTPLQIKTLFKQKYDSLP